MRAFAYRSGEIEFGRAIPDGALPIARGRDRDVRRLVEATARHAYDGTTLLVPGVPEAADDDAALVALVRFRDWINAPRRATPGRAGPA